MKLHSVQSVAVPGAWFCLEETRKIKHGQRLKQHQQPFLSPLLFSQHASKLADKVEVSGHSISHPITPSNDLPVAIEPRLEIKMAALFWTKMGPQFRTQTYLEFAFSLAWNLPGKESENM